MARQQKTLAHPVHPMAAVVLAVPVLLRLIRVGQAHPAWSSSLNIARFDSGLFYVYF
jgi:hypothetical protein